MNKDDLILVSVDDHTIEPPDMFEGRVPKKFAEAAPRIVHREDGTDAWVYNSKVLPNVGLSATVGRPPEEYGVEPTSFAEMRRGTYDVHERVKDMSANGVLAGLCFPSFVRFTGFLFAEDSAANPEQALAMVRAYNDWHIEAWCGEYPDRFIPLAITPMWDPQLMAQEVRRVAEMGVHAVTFSANPYSLGFPSLFTDHWDPFWAACEECGTVVCVHLGTGGAKPTSPETSMSAHLTGIQISLYTAAADYLWSPIFRKFDRLKIALSEGGIGWVPYFLERADFVYKHHSAWTGDHFDGRLPSEIFNEHVITCFIEDKFGVANLDYLNSDMVTWECDYPHSDCTWPESPEVTSRYLTGLSVEDVAKVTHLNAMRLFSFDPFVKRPPESCTVGALRQEVRGHDISLRSYGVKENRITTTGERDKLGLAGTDRSLARS
jgi:predicted TIM-barrel fold metal-dependent hydrolase